MTEAMFKPKSKLKQIHRLFVTGSIVVLNTLYDLMASLLKLENMEQCLIMSQ